MRAVVQRVTRASVTVDGHQVGSIGHGLVVLLGAGEGDTGRDVAYMANKIVHLRVFEDDAHNMNRSLLDVGGGALVVSQFTLYGDCRKGRRPSFVKAARPGLAIPLYEGFCDHLRTAGVSEVQTGIFGAMMDVDLVNDGPVTLVVDTP